MSSTAKMMQAARERRRAEALAVLPNTVDWVDEAYAERLTRQLYRDIQNMPRDAFLYLGRVRKMPAYLCEEPVQGGTRVYAIDRSLIHPERELMLVVSLIYDREGEFDPTRTSPGSGRDVYLTRHATQRLFQRLRSNARADVLAIVKKLTALPEATEADLGKEIELDVGCGTCCLIGDRIKKHVPAGTCFDQIHADGSVTPGITEEDSDRYTPAAWFLRTYLASGVSQ